MVRVAFAGISHETNTFATAALGVTTLEQFNPRTGAAALKGGDGYMGGLVHKAEELGYECVGLLFGITEPSGTIEDSAFESMRDGIISRLKQAMPVDAVAIENRASRSLASKYEPRCKSVPSASKVHVAMCRWSRGGRIVRGHRGNAGAGDPRGHRTGRAPGRDVRSAWQHFGRLRRGL